MNIRIHFRFKNEKHIKENIRIVSIVGQMDSVIKEGILKNRYIGLEGTYAKEYLKGDVIYDNVRPEIDRFLTCRKNNARNFEDFIRLGTNSLPMFKEFLKEHNINI